VIAGGAGTGRNAAVAAGARDDATSAAVAYRERRRRCVRRCELEESTRLLVVVRDPVTLLRRLSGN
jgi:hypothetical protein